MVWREEQWDLLEKGSRPPSWPLFRDAGHATSSKNAKDSCEGAKCTASARGGRSRAPSAKRGEEDLERDQAGDSHRRTADEPAGLERNVDRRETRLRKVRRARNEAVLKLAASGRFSRASALSKPTRSAQVAQGRRVGALETGGVWGTKRDNDRRSMTLQRASLTQRVISANGSCKVGRAAKALEATKEHGSAVQAQKKDKTVAVEGARRDGRRR